MSKSITQNMAYRQSLMKYTEKYGVSRASRKYNKSRSYIYFWKQRWDGSVASLACQSRRPHSHPNQHTEAELKLIRDMRRRNPELGMIELWHRLRQRGYTRRPESLFRIMRKMGMFPPEKLKKTYKPKPYEQMTYGWEFLFLGANIDAAKEAARFGIGADRSVNYKCDKAGTALNYEVISEAVCSVRAAQPLSADWKRRIDEDVKKRGR